MKSLSYVLVVLALVVGVRASALSVDTVTGVNANAQVGGVKAEVKGNATSSANSNKDTSTSSGSSVSAAARDVRGWDEGEKQEFLSTVKTHAELKSGQDLENFAKGVLVEDENVSGVVATENSVEVRYKLPAKFLGVFGASLDAIVNVSFETTKSGRGPKEVTVKFPWYKMFFSLSTSTRTEILEAAIDKSVKVNAQVPRDNEYAQNGKTIQLISNILKGIRAEVSANTN